MVWVCCIVVCVWLGTCCFKIVLLWFLFALFGWIWFTSLLLALLILVLLVRASLGWVLLVCLLCICSFLCSLLCYGACFALRVFILDFAWFARTCVVLLVNGYCFDLPWFVFVWWLLAAYLCCWFCLLFVLLSIWLICVNSITDINNLDVVYY